MILALSLLVIIIALAFYSLRCFYQIKKINQQSQALQEQLTKEQEKQRILNEEVIALQQQVSHDVLTDPLTGLPSRKIFEDHLVLTVNQSVRHQLTFSVMFLDLDGFKIINDALGYDKGDQLLKEIATRLKNCVRQVDTMSRFAGDEFVFIFSQINKAETAAYIAKRLLDAIAEPLMIGDQELFVTASIGIAVFPNDGNDGKTLLKNADIALHQAKLEGHHTYQFFREEMHALSRRELLLSASLCNPATFHDFTLSYRPRINVETKKVVCMEAILHWQHPEFGSVTFEELSKLAEKNNSIMAINEWILKTACHDLLQWRENGFQLQEIAMPISLKQFENSHFIQKISNMLQDTHLDAGNLIFEVLESSLLTKIELVEKMLHMVKRLGVKIAINNFSASQLQLQQLRHLAIDIFKIDHALVFDITTNKESEAIVKTIIALANSLQLVVVADGIEDVTQKNALLALGCKIMQGDLFSREVSAREFTAEALHW